ncbi:MAG: hypothetical protein M1816_002178 [Peltula sp. TS41687]|nr:MAG: hypothetical protein M1816_002178 [Peltula sp. TS41687]
MLPKHTVDHMNWCTSGLLIMMVTVDDTPAVARHGSSLENPAESKMIDFAIYEYLQPSEAKHNPLQIRPISVNIEIKRTGEGWDAATAAPR